MDPVQHRSADLLYVRTLALFRRAALHVFQYF